MPKIKQCDRCQFYANNPHLVCAIHPGGVETDTCLDYRLNVDYIFNEQWCPDGYVYYDDELIKLPENGVWQRLVNFTAISPLKLKNSLSLNKTYNVIIGFSRILYFFIINF